MRILNRRFIMQITLDPTMKKLLDMAIQRNASDLHLTVGIPPMIRIDGKLANVPDEPILDATAVSRLIQSFMTPEQLERLKNRKELDFSFGYQNMRFRTNGYFQKGNLAASLRLIPKSIKSITELGLPPVLEKFTTAAQGFFIITWPTGHGKSTTLAAMVNHINKTRSEHIVTIEDPIEYVFEHQKSIISQREVGSDTESFARALRSSLREDPNVVLVGE